MTNPYYFVRDQRHCLSLMSYKGQIQKIQKLRSVIPKPKSIRELGREPLSKKYMIRRRGAGNSTQIFDIQIITASILINQPFLYSDRTDI